MKQGRGIGLGALTFCLLSLLSFSTLAVRATDFTVYDMTTDGAWQGATGTTRIAQAFTSDSGGRYLKSVRIRVRNANSTNSSSTQGQMTLSLWSSTGTVPQQKVTDLIVGQTVGQWADGDFTFTATSDIDLGALAQQYFVVFQSTNTVSWKCDTTSPTPGAAVATFVRKISSDGGTTWTDFSSGNCSGKYFNLTVVATDVSLTPASSTTQTIAPTTVAPTTTTNAPTTTLEPTTTTVSPTTTVAIIVPVTTSSVPRRLSTSSTSTSTTTTSTSVAPTTSTTSTVAPISGSSSANTTQSVSSANLFGEMEQPLLTVVGEPGVMRDDVRIRVSATNLEPGTPIRVQVFSEPITVIDDIAPSSGKFDVEASLPSTLLPGTHTVILDVVTRTGSQRSLAMVELDEALRVVSVIPAAVVSADINPNSDLVSRAVATGYPVYQALSQPKATAGLAISVTAVLSLVAGGVTAMGQASTRRRESRGKVSSFVTKKLKATGTVGEARGDKSATWKLPFTQKTDRWSQDFPGVVGRYSSTLPRIAVDGSWMRAWSGSLFLLMWLTSFIAGVALGISGPGVVAPSATAVIVLSGVGLLDAGAGFSAWLGIAVGALIAGNITDAYDIRTLMGLIAILTGLSPLTHVIRPLRRTYEDRGDVIERLFDYAIAPIFVAFAASSMLKALNGLSGLQLVTPETVKSSVVFFGLFCVMRLGSEDLIHRFYPWRMANVQPDKLRSPGKSLSLLSVLPRSAIFLFIAVPFFGWTWQTFLSAVFLAVPLVLKPFEDDLPNVKAINQWLPRGLFRFLCLFIIGMWLAPIVVPAGDAEALRRGAVWLLIPGLVVGVVEMFGRFGGEWRNVRLKWSLGFFVWLTAAGLVSGIITLF